MPGINVLGATIIRAEIGRDMSRFPTAGHLLAWAGTCPGQNESAGKRTSSRLRKGAPWVKTMGGDAKEGQLLRSAIQAAACQAWTEESDLRRRRLDAHGDLPYAEGRDVPWDLGADHFDLRSSEVKARHHVAQLARLGFNVELQPAAQAA